MRLNINLATLKYEDVRRFYVRWGATVAALSVLAILLAAFSYVKYSRAKQSALQIRTLQQQIDTFEKQRNQMIAKDQNPANRDVTQQRSYWNNQIAKRAFSWTQLLNDMQRIMPSRAFLQTVQPELTQDNRLKLRLTIVGEKREDARELQKRMESSSRFNEPRIVAENIEKETRPGAAATYRFEIETFYTPGGPAISLPPKERGQASRAHWGHRGILSVRVVFAPRPARYVEGM
jgi:type IV pilus assembly protein PilN